MIKNTILFLFLLMSSFSYSQDSTFIKHKLGLFKFSKKEKNNLIITGSLMILSGMSDGLNQTLSFNYNNFKKVFPNANDNWWNPKISYLNKYKNSDPTQGERFIGSKTFFVFTTDGYHFTRMVSNISTISSLSIRGYYQFSNIKKPIIIFILRDFLFYGLCRGIGFNIAYSLIFKN